MIPFFLLPLFLSAAQDITPLWTDTIRSAEGTFAVNIDPETKMVNILRSDDRVGLSPHLRVQILRLDGTEHEIRLSFEVKPGSLLRYMGHDTAWDGSISGFHVEHSSDGKNWKKLIPLARPQ